MLGAVGLHGASREGRWVSTSGAHVGTCQRSFSARYGCHSLAWECGAAGRDRGVCRDGVSQDRPGFGSLPRSPPWGILQGCNPVGKAWGGQGTPRVKGTVCVSAQCSLCWVISIGGSWTSRNGLTCLSGRSPCLGCCAALKVPHREIKERRKKL